MSLQPSAFSLQFVDQTEEHSSDLVGRLEQLLSFNMGEKSQSQRKCQKGLDFLRGSKADSQESGEVWVCSSPVSLGDVCWDRRTCSSQLRSQPELFIRRKGRRQTADHNAQIHTLLPNLQILIARLPHPRYPSTMLPAEGRRLTD